MVKLRMASNLHRFFIGVTMITILVLASFCEADNSNESGSVDSGSTEINNDNSTESSTGLTESNDLWNVIPIMWLMDFLMTTFWGQRFPCTVFSIMPMEISCAYV
ncbi:uncharacterized protein LOC124411608 [Diprion similis]|uniref:uncharacterized protein LOC124411608 n=1 Tax=Diprion similis TaxID=362088 RepID=UPI001EF7C95B|nr:uncharacterized protein LOC124411608 [Diprion similis]